MEKRSLFKRLFESNTEATNQERYTEFKLLDGNKAIFTPYRGEFDKDPDVLTCIDAIARNGAKMHPKHLRETEGEIEYLKGKTYRFIAEQPNELQNAYQFYYQVIATLELYNEAFIYIKRDKDLNIEGLYPLIYTEGKLFEYQDKLYLKFKFGRNSEKYIPMDSCIHLTRFLGDDGLSGGDIKPIIKTLSMKHILDEGIINAIRTTSSIRGVVKSTKALLKPEDVKKMRDQFVKDFIIDGDRTGVGGLDATTDFIPVHITPTTASESQIKEIDDKVLSYFGINKNILQSSYNENEWNAFYESVLEPIGIQMSLEFTNKIFTPTQKFFGNKIVFESNRLQYASNNTKIELIRYASNIMTVNEQREVFNLAPIDGGDIFLIDQNHEANENIGGGKDETEGN